MLWVATIGSVAHAGVLDAHWDATPLTASYGVHSHRSLAQSFTVEQSGILDRVELQIGRETNTEHPLIVEIRRNDPTGLLVTTLSFASAIVPVELLPTAWIGLDLGPQSFAVTSGDQLVLVAKSAASGVSGTDDWYSWTSNSTIPGYTQGMAFAAEAPFTQYTPALEVDLGFQTYVSVPEPSSLLLTMLGLGALSMVQYRRSAAVRKSAAR